jgi:hypothetical protein
MDHNHDGHDNDHDSLTFDQRAATNASQQNQDPWSCIFLIFYMMEQLEGYPGMVSYSNTFIRVVDDTTAFPGPCPVKNLHFFFFSSS